MTLKMADRELVISSLNVALMCIVEGPVKTSKNSAGYLGIVPSTVVTTVLYFMIGRKVG
jgi:hypothetical protein